MAVAALLASVSTGCGAFSKECTAQLKTMLIVETVNDATGEAVALDAAFLATPDGTREDISSRCGTGCILDESGRKAGTYELELHALDQVVTQSVEVRSDGCHLETEELTVHFNAATASMQ